MGAAYDLEWVFPTVHGSVTIDREKQAKIVDEATNSLLAIIEQGFEEVIGPDVFDAHEPMANFRNAGDINATKAEQRQAAKQYLERLK